MDLVDRDRRRGGLPLGAACHPALVGPAQRPRRGHDRGRAGRELGLLRHRIGLVGLAHAARRRRCRTCSARPRPARHEQLPDAGRKAQPHGMATRIPRIEIADHRHALGVGRPHREAHALHAVDRDDVGAQRLGQLEMPAFVEQVQIELAQQRAEGIGILGLLHRGGPLDAQQIGRGVGHGAFEQARHLVFAAAVPSGVRSPRRSTSTDCAPGRKARMMRPAGPSCGPSTPKASRWRAVASASASRTVEPQLSAAAVHDWRSGADARRRLAMRARPPTGMASQVGRLAAS